MCAGPAQQTRDIAPLLVQCWSIVYDAGPTLNRQWVNVSCVQALIPYLRKGSGNVVLLLVNRLRHWLNVNPSTTARDYIFFISTLNISFQHAKNKTW